MAESERTRKLRKEYVQLHFEDGLTPREAAVRYNLHYTTVYRVLKDLADQLGIPYEDLLEKPNAAHVMYDRMYETVKPINVEALRIRLEDSRTKIRECRTMISKTLENMTE